MRKIPKKNYIIVIIMFCAVIALTLAGARFYNNSIKETSTLYNYIKSITKEELDQYLSENPSTVLYISDKYNLSNNENEELLKSKIIKFNLYNNFIYMDKNQFDSEFVKRFNSKYKIKLDINKLPVIIIYSDSYIKNIYYSVDAEIISSLSLGDVK